MEEVYFKVFDESDKHHDFQYHDGINEEPECGNGMFFTTREHIHKFYEYGTYIRKVIPLGKVIQVGRDKFKTNKLELKKRYWLGDLNTYKELNIPMINMNISSMHGFISILKWWKENVDELVYSDVAMDLASAFGHVDVLNWWKENVDELLYSELAFDWASKKGHVNVLKWLKENVDELKYTEYSMDFASANGHINVLNWWKENVKELKYSEKAMDWALKNGHKNVLNWWKESGLLEE
jgi:hypothetical protein